MATSSQITALYSGEKASTNAALEKKRHSDLCDARGTGRGTA